MYLTDNPETSWKNALKNIEKSLNRRYNRSIGMAPVESVNRWKEIQDKNAKLSKRKPFPEYLKEQQEIAAGKGIKDGGQTFHLGDKVIIPFKRTALDKESDRGYSFRIYKIKHIYTEEEPYMYKIVTAEGNKPMPGLYYGKQLKKVGEPEYHPVEKILKKKKVGKDTFYLTKFLDYPKDQAEWLKEDMFKKK